jgi:hypothetical protein
MRPFPRLGLPDAAAPADPWEPLRRPPRHSDEALTGTTRAWLRRLPAGRRPQLLCMQFPRVANRIAWQWADPPQAQAVLDDLLHDRRGGRAGFPAPVVQELRRLRDFLDRAAEQAHPAGHLDLLRRWWPRH